MAIRPAPTPNPIKIKSIQSSYVLFVIFLAIFLTLSSFGVHAQKQVKNVLISPCPRVFVYEPLKYRDRWYGTVTLNSDSELSGVWLRLKFDRMIVQVANWLGEVMVEDNNEFLIVNHKHVIKSNAPYLLKFYVRYNSADVIPRLKEINLNGKTICPEIETKQTTGKRGQAATSTTALSMDQLEDSFINLGGIRYGQEEEHETEDFFPGDFSLLSTRPSERLSLFKAIPSKNVECGTVAIRATPLISHGEITKEGEFPWHAALYYAKGVDLAYICGASLISYRHVLTVAHCVTKKTSKHPLNPENLIVYLGKHYLRRWSNPSIQDSQVSKIIIHPLYEAQKYLHDIAVIELAKPVDFTDYVRPICLWEDSSNIDKIVNTLGTVIGWGIDEHGHITEQLTKAKMPVVPKATCINSFPDFFSRYTTDRSYCAGFRNGTSVCNGDSGGGMVFPKIGSGNRQIWHIRGLISLSVALQKQFTCDVSHYVVLTDVAKYLDWINAAMI